MSIPPLAISAYTLVNALGRGVDGTVTRLLDGVSGLRPCDFEHADLPTWIGRIDGLEDEPVDRDFTAYDCRNNRLARVALLQDRFATAIAVARARVGANRVGVFVGTSTAGILETEHAYRGFVETGVLTQFSYRHTQDIFSVADFTRAYLELEGPAVGISTACSSSAKVFASAYRYLRAGQCDAAVVGGVDSLCLTTLYGFHSLELTSPQPCRPWDAARDGLSIGEAGGFALLEWRAVFASSGGDSEIINSICTALARPQRAVSPTQFHNSVHNSPAGYWAIATLCHSSSVSLSAYDGSFAAGLLEAVTTALVEGGPVLLVAYDYPPPEPLSQVRGFCAPFAAAMLIDARPGPRAMASFDIALARGEREDRMRDKELESLRTGNPAARALPLLEAIARQEARRVVLPYLPDTRLAVEVRPADGY
ncbi:MAG: beta-ketoacyl synthase chain length factor [Gammaproteobacteria bacterium]|nr:beta-ketoacyl synthase chain length factor [Gammaproteobacteria bacterium]